MVYAEASDACVAAGLSFFFSRSTAAILLLRLFYKMFFKLPRTMNRCPASLRAFKKYFFVCLFASS